MADPIDALTIIKQVLVLHALRQQIEADIAVLRDAPLRLGSCLFERLEALHAALLARIGEHKRTLRRQGVRITKQQKNSLDFQIAYVERGYQIQHCFLLATLQAESQVLFATFLEGGSL